MPTVLSHGMLPLLIWALSSAQSSSLVTSGVTTSSITRSSSCRSSGSCHRHCPPSPSSQSSRTSSTRLLFPSSQSSSHHYNNNDPSRIRRRGNNSRSFTVATFARGTASAGASAVANPDSPISNHTKNYNTIESLSTETTEDDVGETTATTATTTTLEPKLDLPRHIAFICDGNSRWARRKSLPESMGHVAGAERVVSLIRTLLNYPSSSSSPSPSSSTTTMQQHPSPDDNESMRQSEKQNNDDNNNNNNNNNNNKPPKSSNSKPQRIEYCTLFAFSTENWSRPPAEIAALFAVVERAARRHRRHDAVRSGRVQFELLGNLDDGRIPSGAREELRALEGESRAACGRRRREAKEKAAAKAKASDERRSGRADDNNDNEDEDNEEEECNVLTISLAINYGGRADLLRAAASLTRSVLSGDLPPSALDDPAELSRRLCTADLPDPDLIVRTGGERRLSNFLLWEAAYAELYFTEDLWPEFDEVRLEEALGWYGRRKRNFGGR